MIKKIFFKAFDTKSCFIISVISSIHLSKVVASSKHRVSNSQRKPTYFVPDFVALLLENEPQTFKAAMSSSESTIGKKQSIVRLNQF